MASGFSASLFLLALFLKCSASQQPNTDAFYVSDFLQRMGATPTLTTFSSSSSICSLRGVACDAGQERVVSLTASGLGLSGTIPENTIGKLGALRSLDLSGNRITGLPSDFWGLGAALQNLNLSSNRLSGGLPNNVGNFGRLQSLDLSVNALSGEIPAALGSLSRLALLDLSRNSFAGAIPDGLLGLRFLVSIDLSGNGLNGTVPDGFGKAFERLRALDLSGNELRGRLPNLTGLEHITYLNLSHNLFQGSILGVFRESLEVIDLSKNQLQGHISQVSSLNSSFSWPSLGYLDVSGNELSGEFFRGLGEARALKHLNLASNRFSPEKFPNLEKLSGLEYLNLSMNNLTGQIPVGISQLVTLKVLDLSQNHLTGRIPDLSVGDIEVLDLSMNNLTGQIPVGIWQLVTLKVLDLSQNHLTGRIPDLSVGDIDVLDVSMNNLTGEIPLALQQKLIGMERFNFSYNNLTLCGSKFSPRILETAFVGSQNDCPIAVYPTFIRENARKHRGLKLALVIALSLFFLIAGIVCLIFGLRRRTREWAVKQLSFKEEPNISGPFSFQTDSTTWVADVKVATSVPVVIFEKPLLNVTFADLLTATSHFDRGTLLAEGRFGPVYRGFLPGGIHVAVKVLVHGSTLTDQEAARELERLGRIKHPNLVPLTGYCLAGDQRIAIYEYMENGNLQNLLHDLPLGVQTTEDWSNDTWEDDRDGVHSITTEGLTTWRFRHKIALGTARALAFLHHGCFPQIVHRDVKASSIYLDTALEPRLSDFGLAKVVGSSLEDVISRGSPGYTPPEFSESQACEATSKTDVYGFGVVLFELITGKKPLADEYPEEKESTLVGWARSLVRKNQGSKAIDPKIMEMGSEKHMVEALRIAYLCTADLPSKRPSMQQIVGLLKDIEPLVPQQ